LAGAAAPHNALAVYDPDARGVSLEFDAFRDQRPAKLSLPEANMNRFKVKLFSSGLWKKQDYVSVEAPTPKAAAEFLTGLKLVDKGPPGLLVALVLPEFIRTGTSAVAFYAGA
jgi:hypothetical protein